MGVKNSNCWKYFLSKAPYDVLVAITMNPGICPIDALTGKAAPDRCSDYESCKECISHWLNEKLES